MEKKSMDKLIGKYCKIVTTEPGEERTHVVFGIVTNIDHDTGLLVIESNPGLRYLKIETRAKNLCFEWKLFERTKWARRDLNSSL